MLQQEVQWVLFMQDGEIIREFRFEENEKLTVDDRFEKISFVMREIEI